MTQPGVEHLSPGRLVIFNPLDQRVGLVLDWPRLFPKTITVTPQALPHWVVYILLETSVIFKDIRYEIKNM